MVWLRGLWRGMVVSGRVVRWWCVDVVVGELGGYANEGCVNNI